MKNEIGCRNILIITILLFIMMMALLLSSCYSVTHLKQGIADHYLLYYRTKAVRIVDQDKSLLILENFPGTKRYGLKVIDYVYHFGTCPEMNDTIIINENPELICRFKFLR